MQRARGISHSRPSIYNVLRAAAAMGRSESCRGRVLYFIRGLSGVKKYMRPWYTPLVTTVEVVVTHETYEGRLNDSEGPWLANLSIWLAKIFVETLIGSECQVSKLGHSGARPRPRACTAGQPVGHQTTSLGGRARMGSVRSAKFLHRFYIVSTSFLHHFYIVSTT
jgi:hypothetical protein